MHGTLTDPSECLYKNIGDEDVIESEVPELEAYSPTLASMLAPTRLAAFSLLPIGCQVVLHHLFYTFACATGVHYLEAKRAVDKAHRRFESPISLFSFLAQLDSAYIFFPGDADGGHRNILRMGNRMCLALVAISTVQRALRDILAPRNISTPIWVNEVMFDFEDTRLAFLEVSQARNASNSLKFVAGAPGVATQLGSSDNGVKYLLSALSKSGSALVMPSVEAKQQTWINWFAKLREVLQHYAISEAKVIHTVTGHLPADHTVMFGWQQIADDLRADGREPTLREFERHVTNQLFVRTETRSAAYKELEALPHKVADIADCHTLITKLKQLFMQLFPEFTDEREPISRYEACLAVHKIVTQLHAATPTHRSTALVHALSQYQFDHTALYFEHLEVPPVSLVDSKLCCTQYLEAIFAHLVRAQRMHNRVHGETKTNPAQPKGNVVAAAAEKLGTTATQLRKIVQYNNNKGTGHTGKRDNSSQATGQSPAKRAKSSDAPRRNNRGGGGGGGGKVAAADDGAARSRRLEELERNRPNGDSLADLAQSGGVTRSLDACIGLVQAKKCVFCSKSHKNFVTCSTLTDAQKSAASEVAQRRKQLSHESYNHPNDFGAALRACNLSRKWTPPAL